MNSAAPTDNESSCRFEVAVQKSRALVYIFATAVAIVVKLLGAVSITWMLLAGFALLALLTALLIGSLAARGRLKVLGVPVRPLWMAADVVMITAQVYASGGSQSSWFPWYLANAAAAMWVSGTSGFLLVMGANSLAYLGTVALTEPVSAATLGMVLGRLLMIYGAGFYALMGIARLQQKRRIIADLREEEHTRATELQRLADELEEREERLRTLTETAASAIFVLQDDALVFVNHAAEEISGFSRDELLRMSFWSLLDPRGREEAQREAAAVVATGGASRRYDTKLIRKDGAPRWLELTAGVIHYGGKPALLGSAFDITDRRRFARALGESERALATLLSNLPGMAYRCANDQAWTMSFVSEGSRELTGYEPAELVGAAQLAYANLMHPGDRLAVWKAMQAALAVKQPYSLEYRITTAGGEERWVKETGRGVFSGTGELEALEGIVTDITRERLVEEQLRRAQKMEAVGQLAGGVAHDFNNLLMAIQGSAEILQRRMPATDPAQGEVGTVIRAAARAAELTHGLLAFARKQVLSRVDLDLDLVVAEMLPLLRRVIPESIVVEHVRAPEQVVVRADRGQIEQVLMNLCVNARDAMPQGGRLTIECSVAAATANVVDGAGLQQEGRQAVLTVRDSGKGMDATILARAFEPFFSTKEQGRGTGLGLAVVYGIVKQHGGQVRVDSRPGEGATFSVLLPCVERTVGPTTARTEPPARGGGERILIVEDEPEVRRVLVDVLLGLGYRVRDAQDGVEALEILHRDGGDIDLVISDVVMPRMGGERLYEEAARLPRRPAFLFSTGYAPQMEGEGSVLSGAFFISKPYGIDEVSRKVREVLDSRAAP